MIESLERHIALLEAKGEQYMICHEKVYRPYGHVVCPYGPSKFDYTIGADDAIEILKGCRKQMLLCWDGFHTKTTREWYAVICDRFTPVDACKAKLRSEIKRGLANCEIRRIDAEYLARQGYAVYLKAFGRYRSGARPAWDEEQFSGRMRVLRRFPDIVHPWGAFSDNQLIAFSLNTVFDRIEALYATIKTDPDYLRLYPVYALIYRMNEYYLSKGNVEYVCDGWRSLVHATGIQDFLVKKFGFYKAYSHLLVVYRPCLRTVVQCAYPFRGPLGRLSARVQALLTIEEIQRSCRQPDCNSTRS